MFSETRIFLIGIYPLLLLGRLLNRLHGHDRLRLDPPADASYWIERRSQPDTISYFSETSCSEGYDEPSAARPLTLLLRCIARLFRPSLQDAGAGTIYAASAGREQRIPDEIYPLW